MSLRWTEEEYTRYTGQVLPRPETPPAPVSEKVFQDAVQRVAREAGWVFQYHTYRSTKSPSGFPDMILCHREPGHVCYAVELKTDTGQVTPAQTAWLTALGGCTGVVAEVWRPAMLQEVVERLRA